MTALDLLHHLIDQVYAEGFAAGRNSVLGETHRADEGDGPAAGISWEMVARHCESHPNLLSLWEREMADSVLCSLYFKVPLTARQKMKMQWIFANRFGGKLS